MPKVNLNKDQYAVLKFIKQYYDYNKNGCLTVSIVTSRSTLLFLEKGNLIFKTKDGYFPTTEGQTLVKNTERNTYLHGKKYKLKKLKK